MKYASEDLKNEHEGILFGLKILEKMVKGLQEGKTIPIEDMKDMTQFLQLFADKCHHGKEEGLMFPAMEKAGIPNAGGPIGEMLSEHEQGRKYIKSMKESVEQSALDKNKWTQNAIDYIKLLRTHIDKENKILFPLADQKIPMEKQAQLIELFEEHEETVMGKGTHEKLHEMLHQFKKKYSLS